MPGLEKDNHQSLSKISLPSVWVGRTPESLFRWMILVRISYFEAGLNWCHECVLRAEAVQQDVNQKRLLLARSERDLHTSQSRTQRLRCSTFLTTVSCINIELGPTFVMVSILGRNVRVRTIVQRISGTTRENLPSSLCW